MTCTTQAPEAKTIIFPIKDTRRIYIKFMDCFSKEVIFTSVLSKEYSDQEIPYLFSTCD